MENPNVGKTTAAHRLQKIALCERNTMSTNHRGNDLLSSFLGTRGGYNEEATTSVSVSLSPTLYNLTFQQYNYNNNNYMKIVP